MASMAAVTLLEGLGHLANVADLYDLRQAKRFQQENVQWARRAHRLDSQAL